MIKQTAKISLGEVWLNALEELFRGKILKTKFSFDPNCNLEFKGNKIISKIITSGTCYHNCIAKIKEVSEEEKGYIIDSIMGNAFYLSEILNRKIPTEMYDDLISKNIFLFPLDINSIYLACTCNEISYPCKHLVKMLYQVSYELNKNPFLLFCLHSIDISEHISKSGFRINCRENSTMSGIDKIMSDSCIDTEVSDSYFESKTFDPKIFDEIDFSIIPCLKDTLLNILTGKPAFYQEGDFKKVIDRIYRNTMLKTTRFLEDMNSINPDMEIYRDISFDLADIRNIFIDANYDFKFGFLNDSKKAPGKTIFFALMNLFNSITGNEIKNYPEKVITLYLVYDFCLNLLHNGAVIPQVFKTSESCYRIRWVPPLINEEVKSIFESLIDLFPNDFVIILTVEEEIEVAHKITRNEQLLSIISFFLNNFIKYFNKKNMRESNRIESLFFGNAVFNTKNKSKPTEIVYSINLWLSRFYLSHKDVVPVIKIDSDMNTYVLEILLEKKNSDTFIEHIRLNDIFEKDRYASIKNEVLKDLNLLSEYMPIIHLIINSRGDSPILINSVDFVNIFFNILPTIKLLGIKVLLPRELNKILKPRLTLSVAGKKSVPPTINYMELNDILSFEWKIAIGENILTKNEFLKVVKGLHGIVRIRDRFVYLDEKEIESILEFLKTNPELSNVDLLKIGIREQCNASCSEVTKEAKRIYDELFVVKEAKMPMNLKAELREYQHRGYNWLYNNIRSGFGCLIADDMGLGKTLQVITALLKLKEEGLLKDKKALVIVPTTLLTNWSREISKFSPDMRISVYHGKDRKFDFKGMDIVLTTYGIIRSELESFRKPTWRIIVLDEAHNIKNPNASQTRSVKKLKSSMKIAVTGTPVENRLLEIWSIFDFLNKNYLGSLQAFKREYAIPIEVFKNQEKLRTFKTLTSPFTLRRLKSDKNVIRDLPEKIEIDEYCYLTKEQSALYQNIVNKSLAKIDESDGIERKGLVLKLMISLKQICNHPGHYIKNSLNLHPELSGKAMMLMTILEKIFNAGEKVLIFTQYREMGEIILKILSRKLDVSIPFLHGGVSRKNRDALIENFQTDKHIKGMLLTLKAGGIGLNLTKASNIIHYDLWWNPATESQATDRSYRIGQTKNVTVHRLITQGTLEEKINTMINEKKELLNLAVSRGEQWFSELSNEEIRYIINLDEKK